MSNAINTCAIDLYFAAFDSNAMQPNVKLSFLTKSGAVVLKNMNPSFFANRSARTRVEQLNKQEATRAKA